MSGDRHSPEPDDGEPDHEQHEQADRDDARRARPPWGTPAYDNGLGLLGPVRPLVCPLLVHWPLVTTPAHHRSRCGMTASQSAAFCASRATARTAATRDGMDARAGKTE